jgi:hypothetical protein
MYARVADSIYLWVFVAFTWSPSLAETCEDLILLSGKTLLHFMGFNPNFT